MTQRDEIQQHGLQPDAVLSANPDIPVFGLNLACAYPFPSEIQQRYESLASQLAGLDSGGYVYPHWETHITVMTLVNFNLNHRPSAQRLSDLQTLVPRIIACLRSLSPKPFSLEFEPPIVTRKAVILPISNATDEIASIRREATTLIEHDKDLHRELSREGMNVPGIIHSTIMRFQKTPNDLAQFIDAFDAIASIPRLGGIRVNEILLTAETKPYMREGKILHRWPPVSP